jgi:hypothetical protein
MDVQALWRDDNDALGDVRDMWHRGLESGFHHGWPYWKKESMNEELFRRFVEAVETIAALHVRHDERSIARQTLEKQAHDNSMAIAENSMAIAERQTTTLQQLADQQANHIKQCEESHKRTEDLARARSREREMVQ